MSKSGTGGFAFGSADLVTLDPIKEDELYVVVEEDVIDAKSEVKHAKAKTASLAAAAEKDMAELASLIGKLKTSTASKKEKERYESLHAKLVERVEEAEKSKHKLSTAEKKYYETSTKFKEKELLVALKAKEIRSVIRAVCAAESVDLAFLLDCTSSMSPHIKAVKQHIKDIVHQIMRTNGSLKIRLALVGYRDFCDKGDRLEVLDFVSSVESFEGFVDKIVAKGGGDTPEDVAGAVQEAHALSWKHPTRVVFLIADAPCHGTRFHSNSDDYPKGSPGVDIESELKTLASLHDAEGSMSLHFGKINDSTDKMIGRFRKSGIDIEVVPIKDASSLTASVTRGVRKSIFKTMSVTDSGMKSMSFAPIVSSGRSTSSKRSLSSRLLRRRRSDSDVSLKDYRISERVPSALEWKKQPAVAVKVFRNEKINDIEDLQRPIGIGMLRFSDKKRTDITKLSTMYMRRAPRPFAEGEIRLAYHAQLARAVSGLKAESSKMVMKSFKYNGDGLNDRGQYFKQIEVSNIAYFLANMYNKSEYRPSHCGRICFLESCVVEEEADVNERSGNRRFCAEAPLPTGGSEFTKYSNNTGHWNEDNLDETLLRFSEFTFMITREFLMVTDLQGVCKDGEYFLTDPAILCQDSLRFGHTNLGEGFMKKCIYSTRALMADNGWR